MRSDGSLDDEIKALEQRIRDRRVALRASVDELEEAAAQAKQRIKQRAASPLVWGSALALGFIAARFARRRAPRPSWHASVKVGKERAQTPARGALAALLSAALPIALRVAQRSAAPLIPKALHNLQQSYVRRRAYGRYAP